MAKESESLLAVIVAIVVIAGTVWLFSVRRRGDPGTSVNEASIAVTSHQKTTKDKTTSNDEQQSSSTVKDSRSKKKQTKSSKQPSKLPSHPQFVRRVGGHAGTVSAMAVRGEWIATVGTDGQLRVTHTKLGSNLHKQVAVGGSGVQHRDQACSVAWCDGTAAQPPRTVVCVAQRSQAIAFFRMRKKKDAATSDPFPYELIELAKRRFSIADKGTLTASSDVQVLADSAHSTQNNTLVLTVCQDLEHGNVTVWDHGEAVGTLTLPGSGARLSPDGRFVCGRVNGASTQVKLYEVQRKKIKDVLEPVFDKVTPSKAAMTLVTKSSKIVDIEFPGACGGDAGGTITLCKRAIVLCADGTLQLWDLDVEFRQRQDPKLLCSSSNLLPDKASVRLLAAGDSNRIAVVTDQSDLHLLSFHDSGTTPHFTLDCSITATHEDGVGDVQFGPGSRCVYTRGAYSNNVFVWNAE